MIFGFCGKSWSPAANSASVCLALALTPLLLERPGNEIWISPFPGDNLTFSCESQAVSGPHGTTKCFVAISPPRGRETWILPTGRSVSFFCVSFFSSWTDVPSSEIGLETDRFCSSPGTGDFCSDGSFVISCPWFNIQVWNFPKQRELHCLYRLFQFNHLSKMYRLNQFYQIFVNKKWIKRDQESSQTDFQ